MTTPSESEPSDHLFPSTTWAWRKVKIRPAPQAHTTARRRRTTFWDLATGDRGRKWNVTISWRGGAEAWWLIEARGRKQAVPGWLAIEDVMAMVLNESEAHRR